MITIPKQINYVEYYFTLRCNFKCDYCINDLSGVIRKRKELTVDEAINSLNKINFGDIPLTIGGGEPTFRPDFYDLLYGLKSDIKIDLLTNLQFDVNTFIKKISPERFNKTDNDAYKSIRVSYHPESTNKSIISKIKTLQDAGFLIGLFGINHPKNMYANMVMSELARKNNIYFFIKDFLGEYDNELFGYYRYKDSFSKIKKKCKCRSKELLIGPEGNIYKCHRDLYNLEFPVSNIKDDFEIKYIFRDCNMYGFCNLCDVKTKLNRFLQMGHCSVEIENVEELPTK